MARAEAAWRLGAAAALLLHASPPAMAESTLSLCPGDAAEGAALATVYRDAAGGSVTLRLDAVPPEAACARLVLPPPPGDVIAIALLPASAAAGASPTLALQGSRDAQGRLAISQIDNGDGGDGHPVALIAPGRNLVPLWTPRAFGAEERASVRSDDDGDVTLSCRAGTQPAGFAVD